LNRVSFPAHRKLSGSNRLKARTARAGVVRISQPRWHAKFHFVRFCRVGTANAWAKFSFVLTVACNTPRISTIADALVTQGAVFLSTKKQSDLDFRPGSFRSWRRNVATYSGSLTQVIYVIHVYHPIALSQQLFGASGFR